MTPVPKKTDRPVYVDIDGTLTDRGAGPGGEAREDRLAVVRHLIERGYQVVIWSGNGTSYARGFAERHGLHPTACLGKPECCVDDNPTIRPTDRMLVHDPDRFFSEWGAR